MKYSVAVTGWMVVEVEADNKEAAAEIVITEYPGHTGELYDLQVEEIVPADEGFTMHTDLNN